MKILERQTKVYEIVGDNLEMLKVKTGEHPVFSEAGKMIYLRGTVRMETRISGKKDKGFLGKLMEAGKRILAGESLFLTYFEGMGEVGFAGDFPGRILPIGLSGEAILAQKDAFLAAIGNIELSIALQKRIGGALFGGEGFIVEKLYGDGVVFIHAGGDLVTFELAPGETIKVDTGCVVAWDESVSYDVQFVSGIKTALFGGEGLFLTTLTGPGTVVVQTMTLSKLRRQLQAGGEREASESPLRKVAGVGAIGAGVGGILGSILEDED
ncbi:AIM24 family protein [Thermosulfurimonas dismutans]|uniref:DUF124 domain-containing protein n=1 Tax=Thermosulfurimonas dismutans TaxID=999894 RepID=A0A179D1P5_9BACT|nr:AIM24 family protein [Thermosulfurimonas dismutans]OAQ19994.1 DUF124 domain-containing protein [Thermosulfurimonas dismutans]